MFAEVNYGPQDVSPAAWARVTDDETLTTDADRLVAWMELVAQMTDHIETMDEIDTIVSHYFADFTEIRYVDNENGGPQRIAGEKERILIAHYAPLLFKQGLDPHEVASLLHVSLAGLCYALAPQWDDPALVLLAYDLLTQPPTGYTKNGYPLNTPRNVAVQVGVSAETMRQLAKKFGLNLKAKPRPRIPAGAFSSDSETWRPSTIEGVGMQKVPTVVGAFINF